MNLSEEVDLEDYVSRPDKISAAEVRISCDVSQTRSNSLQALEACFL